MVTGFEKSRLMIKKCSYFIGIMGFLVVVLTAFKKYETQTEKNAFYKVDYPLPAQVLTENEFLESRNRQEKEFSLELSKGFISFKEALAFRESQGNYHSVNTLGYLGKYQFGKSTLNFLGIKDSGKFLRDPALQEKAFVRLLAYNKYVLQKDIRKYVGKRVGGILVTESGLLAAAHLGGAGAVQGFLRSNGTKVFSDGYGTNITEYIRKFASFDVSHIKAQKNPKIVS